MLRATLFLLFAATALPGEARVAIEQWTAASGARVSFVESHALPIVDVAVEFAAGSAYDPQEKAGLAQLTLGMFKTGSARYSEAELSRRIADVGAQLRDAIDRDRAGFTLRSLSSEAERRAATDTLTDMLQSPLFAGPAFEREKSRAFANAAEAETRPDSVAERRLYALMYPAHPYGLTANPASIAAISREDVERFYRTYYGAGRAVVTIVGDMSREAARILADGLTSRLPQGKGPDLALVSPAQRGEFERISHPSAQSHVLLGLATLARSDPDYFPLFVGNYILGGGGFVSRLFKELREKSGFAYSAYSYFLPLQREGPFLVGLQTRRDQAGEALARTREVIEEFMARGPTPVELKAAKMGLIGGFPLRIDTNRKVLEQVAVIGFYRLGPDWLDKFAARVDGVTLEQLRSAFARHVDPARLSIVIVGAAR